MNSEEREMSHYNYELCNIGIKKICLLTNASTKEVIHKNDSHLNIKPISKISRYYDENGELRLGPFIGFIISSKRKEAILEGKKSNIYKMLSQRIDKIGGVYVFFSIDDLNMEKNYINGLVLTAASSFEEYEPISVPFPRVIYDRCFDREESRELRLKLQSFSNIKIVNNVAKIGKIEVYELFENHPILKKICIPFDLFSIKNLRNFLQDHEIVYIKPDNLYKGEGVIKVMKKNNGYVFKHHSQGVFSETETSNIEDISMYINDYGNLNSNYVMQKGIVSPDFLGNQYDVRVMLHKNEIGNWKITGSLARLAPIDGTITSPRSGGKVSNLNTVLNDSFKNDSAKIETIKKSMQAMSIEIGNELEKKYGDLCELGIDFGLDTCGNLWLYEVNGKPMKVSLKRLNLGSIYYNVNTYLTMYFSYLDGLHINKSDPKVTEIDSDGVTIKFKSINLQENNIMMSKKLINTLNINVEEEICLQVGKTEVICKAIEDEPIDKNEILMSENLLSKFNLYEGIELKLIYNKGNVISLGPVMSYVISSNLYNRLVKGKPSRVIKYIIDQSKELGCLIYYFTVDNVDLINEKIKACYFNYVNNKWEERIFDFPDLINVRTLFNNIKVDYKYRIKKLKKINEIAFFNGKKAFGKYETYKAMNFFKDTKDLHPLTFLYEGEESLQKIFECHNIAFVKYDFGSGGKSVIRLKKMNNIFECEIGDENHTVKSFNSINEIKKFIEKKLGNKNIIIQKGINLDKYNNRTYDLRVIMQKDETLNWKIGLIVMRLAEEGKNITNTNLGADRIVINPKIINEMLPKVSEDLLTQFVNKCAKSIEAYFGQAGEMGLDIGVDDNGEIYLIEVNGIPSTYPYIKLLNKKHMYQFFMSPIKYSKYLVNINKNVFIEDIELELNNRKNIIKVLDN
ncbi:YheC/YheD family protein [Mycoplasmatota bacterium]|nr:YheC/YheD family protein [Mycoplasmatota bacterium]